MDFNIVENIGSSFGSALIATVVATISIHGFLVPAIVFILLLICWAMIPPKSMKV
ncbi:MULTISPECIES: hypothetical protein [Mammaliicoccus]|uniref:Uncharacterized protein n=1 Tax=Mammaliicoccus sciuri TaxID=1296 RepID=A0A7T4U349_MAMSC|nr:MULTISPECIES: hypothetical protein [Mammaliicoccus]MBF0719923.1 hypothetical protein [Mammaliicoccus sciuri]MBG9204380.1 hypothetical protein [Mammaliicoccus sciuri]MBG9211679.1 hypothetical protein [Mammaliicoccus sciuri]MBO1207285.1 hypothetical protein [Mammaliicoccus sciuri]MBU6089347.1 hypothetical protein [Mammaliicoccus sciuri]